MSISGPFDLAPHLLGAEGRIAAQRRPQLVQDRDAEDHEARRHHRLRHPQRDAIRPKDTRPIV
jgi:hypothetical protein